MTRKINKPRWLFLIALCLLTLLFNANNQALASDHIDVSNTRKLMLKYLDGAGAAYLFVVGEPTLCMATPDNGITVFDTVQAAVNAATTGGWVKVAGDCATINTLGGLPQVVYINKNLTIEGGHTPTNWSLAPNSSLYPTTLDAQWVGRVARVTTNTTATLRHLTLTQGSAQSGGGIHNQGNLWLEYCNVYDNVAVSSGGGILNSSGSVLIDDSTVNNNHATGNGGGFYGVNGELTIQNSTFEANTVSDAGGAIFQTGGSLTMTDGRFEQNVARTGGTHYLQDVATTFANSYFGNNRATGVSVRDFVGGGGAVIALGGTLDITGSRFEENAGCSGGAIYVQNGTLSFTGGILNDNKATDEGGAIYALNSTVALDEPQVLHNSAEMGGALFSSYSQTELDNVVFAGNEASHNGGAIHTVFGTLTGTAHIVDNHAPTGGGLSNQEGVITLNAPTMLEKNDAAGGEGGGALYTAGGTVTLVGVTLVENTALTSIGGGAIHNNNGTLTLTDSFIVNGEAVRGGGLYNHGGEVQMTGEQIASNSAELGGGIYSLYGDVTLSDMLVAGNSAELGGGVFAEGGTLHAEGGSFNSNSAQTAGGIYALDSSTTIDRIAFFNNRATGNIRAVMVYQGGGGAILQDGGLVTIDKSWLMGNSAVESGGALFVETGTLLMERSTLNDNSAQTGGALHNTSGTATIVNSTLYENSATMGGGIVNQVAATATLKNVTVVGNSAENGDSLWNAGTTYLHNSILTHVTYSVCVNSGTLTDDGYSLIEDDSCGLPASGDPLLGPLQDNGGITFTAAPLLGSPAIDAGNCSDWTVTIDQRGTPRPIGAGCDIGAVELRLVPTAVSNNAASADAQNMTWVAALGFILLAGSIVVLNLEVTQLVADLTSFVSSSGATPEKSCQIYSEMRKA